MDTAPSQGYFPVLDILDKVVGGFCRKSAESGETDVVQEKVVCVDEKTSLMRCFRLVRDNGMKWLVVISHVEKTFMGMIERSSLHRIVDTL